MKYETNIFLRNFERNFAFDKYPARIKSKLRPLTKHYLTLKEL